MLLKGLHKETNGIYYPLANIYFIYVYGVADQMNILTRNSIPELSVMQTKISLVR